MIKEAEGKVGVLFVCTGNICRSPMAEGVLSLRLKGAGLADRCRVDSAGLETWHAGKPPDPRAVETALYRGYDLSRLKARKIDKSDFAAFDMIIGCDSSHVAALKRDAPTEHEPRIRLLGEFGDGSDVPDPYFGSRAVFDEAIGLIERHCLGLLIHIKGLLSGTDKQAR